MYHNFTGLRPGSDPGSKQKYPGNRLVLYLDKELNLSIFVALITKRMTGNITFTMIKPDAVEANNIGPILAMINKAGFSILGMKYMRLTREQAAEFYLVHKERPFYGELTEYMSSGPIVAAILKKNNAVADYRKLIGATDPTKADDGTIRKMFAKSIAANAVHGSDSDENARTESASFFSTLARFRQGLGQLFPGGKHKPSTSKKAAFFCRIPG